MRRSGTRSSPSAGSTYKKSKREAKKDQGNLKSEENLEVKEIEGRITKLKAELAKKGSAGAEKEEGAIAQRETRKKLKRAQRQRRVLLVKTAYIETKGKKKEKKGEEGKAAPA